jgi:hypothetical protein
MICIVKLVSVIALGESVNWTKAIDRDVLHVSAADRAESVAPVLAVGDTREWTARGRRVPSDGNVFFVEFHEVTDELLAQLTPRLILSPLLARTFDCVDLAQRLGTLGYAGPYRAIDSGLPDPALIVREVRSLVPGLDFGVVPLG